MLGGSIKKEEEEMWEEEKIAKGISGTFCLVRASKFDRGAVCVRERGLKIKRRAVKKIEVEFLDRENEAGRRVRFAWNVI